MASHGLILLKNNAEIEAEKAAQQKKDEPPQPELTGLAGYLLGLWEQAKLSKIGIEQQILRNARQVNGKYEQDKLLAIKTMGGSEIYMMLTSTKCRAAKAWVNDILRPAGDRPWSLEPTPIPSMPPNVEQEIRQRLQDQVIQDAASLGVDTGQPLSAQQVFTAIEERLKQAKDVIKQALEEQAKLALAGMSDKIDDQLSEGGWQKAFDAVVGDIIKFPAGIMKGPIVRRRKVGDWVADQNGWSYKTVEKLVLEYYRVHPLDMYPESDSSGPNDGYCFERHRMSRKDIVALLGVPGYNDVEIRKALEEFGKGGLKEWLMPDMERAEQENRESAATYMSTKIQALEFWGSCQGSLLLEYEVPARFIQDPLMEYEINAWMIGPYVVKAVVNPDQTGVKPYSVTSFEKIDGSWWGKGLPEVMADSQDGGNAAGRALVNNTGLASGPMVGVDRGKLVPGENGQSIWPWRTFQFDSTGKMPDSTDPIKFFQPTLIARELIEVMDKWERQADEETGVPRYAHGDPNVQGAGNTASGLSMLMTAAARGVKDLIGAIDMDIIQPTIERTYDFNMRFDPDQTIKGDARVIARGVSSLMAKEQRTVRVVETLERSNNPTDNQIIDLNGRKELWKEALKAQDIPTDRVLPDGPVQSMLQGPQGPNGITPEAQTKLNPAGQPAGGADTQVVTRKPPITAGGNQ